MPLPPGIFSTSAALRAIVDVVAGNSSAQALVDGDAAAVRSRLVLGDGGDPGMRQFTAISGQLQQLAAPFFVLGLYDPTLPRVTSRALGSWTETGGALLEWFQAPDEGSTVSDSYQDAIDLADHLRHELKSARLDGRLTPSDVGLAVAPQWMTHLPDNLPCWWSQLAITWTTPTR